MGRIPAPPPPQVISSRSWYGAPRPIPPSAKEQRLASMSLEELWEDYKATAPPELGGPERTTLQAQDYAPLTAPDADDDPGVWIR